MPVPQRLPAVNGDDGQWGDILNQFLTKEHHDTGVDNADNGMHKGVTVRPGSATVAPITLTAAAAALLSTPAAGAIEVDSSGVLYYTETTGAGNRRRMVYYDTASAATGDLLYRDSGGNMVRLGVGSSNQLLVSNAGLPSWQYANAAASALTTKTGTYVITANDGIILANASTGGFTLTLPAASTVSGRSYYVKKTDINTANTVTIAPNGTDNIDGVNSSKTINVPYQSYTFVSDGTDWFII